MNHIKKFASWLLPPLLCFGGGSSSSSSSTTNQTDMRVVGGDQSTNLSTQSNTATIEVTSTDHAAVKTALEMAGAVSGAAQKLSADIVNGAIDSNAQTVSSALKEVGAAYQQGAAGDQIQLKYAGFIVVGLAAVMAISAFKGK